MAIHGLNIPTRTAGVPILFFDTASLASARTWANANAGKFGSADFQLPLAYLLRADTTKGHQAIANALSQTGPGSDMLNEIPPNSAASDAQRWCDQIAYTFDWCYGLMTATQRSTLMSQYNKIVLAWIDNWNADIEWQAGSSNYLQAMAAHYLAWAIATYNDQPATATQILDHVFNERLPYITAWGKCAVDGGIQAAAAGGGKGGTSNEGSDYGKVIHSYLAVAFKCAKQLGRDLFAENSWWLESCVEMLYRTITNAPTHGSTGTGTPFYQIYPGGDDEASGGYPPANDSSREYYGNWACAMIGEYGATKAGQYLQSWLNTCSGISSAHLHWQSVYKPTTALALTTLPLDYYAPGAEYLYVRSDSTPNATCATIQAGNGGGPHRHRDHGSFQLWRKGSWVTKETTGYADFIKGYNGVGQVDSGDATSHNTILFNGNGPTGWNSGVPNVKRLESAPTYSFIAVDLSHVYAGGVKLVRDFIFLRSTGTLIDLSRTVAGSTVKRTSLVHFRGAGTRTGNVFTNDWGGNHLKLSIFGNASLSSKTVNERISTTSGSTDAQKRIELTSVGLGTDYFLSVYQLCDTGASVPAMTCTDNGTSWTLKIGADTVVLVKGASSTGGSVNGLALRATVQAIAVDANGPHWGA